MGTRLTVEDGKHFGEVISILLGFSPSPLGELGEAPSDNLGDHHILWLIFRTKGSATCG